MSHECRQNLRSGKLHCSAWHGAVLQAQAPSTEVIGPARYFFANVKLHGRNSLRLPVP